jgi:hypothetical protein
MKKVAIGPTESRLLRLVCRDGRIAQTNKPAKAK